MQSKFAMEFGVTFAVLKFYFKSNPKPDPNPTKNNSSWSQSTWTRTRNGRNLTNDLHFIFNINRIMNIYALINVQIYIIFYLKYTQDFLLENRVNPNLTSNIQNATWPDTNPKYLVISTCNDITLATGSIPTARWFGLG